MSKTFFPRNMVPVFQLLNGVEIVGTPVPDTNAQGEQKKLGDLPQWSVNVAVPYGPGGRFTRPMKVAVAAATRPAVSDGEIVVFRDLHVGVFITDDGEPRSFYKASKLATVNISGPAHARGDQ